MTNSERSQQGEPRQARRFNAEYVAEQIFFYVLMKGGEGNPFTKIANQWFTEIAAPRICELFPGLPYSDTSALIPDRAATTEPVAQPEEENIAHPFDKLPAGHLAHVNRWLTSNEKRADEVRWSLYPIGMVQRWIERAEKAEA